MRAGLVGILFFAGLLALGHYWGGPAFCRGDFSLSTLDPRQLCIAETGLNRSGSMLLYFASIAVAMLFGLIAAFLPSRKKPVEKKEDKVETFEEIIAKQDNNKPADAAAAAAAAGAVAAAAMPTADATAAAPADAKAEEAAKESSGDAPKAEASAATPEPKAVDPAKSESEAEAAVNAAILAATGVEPETKSAEEKKPEDAVAGKTDEVKAEAEKSDAAKSGEAKSEEPEEVKSEETKSEAANAAPAQADAVKAEDAKPETTKAEQQRTPEEVLEAAVAEALALSMAPEKPEPQKLEPATTAEKKDPEAVLAEAKAVVERKEPQRMEFGEDPKTLATAEAISAGLAANQNGARRAFEGTNEELIERFRELRQHEGINSIAQAQRLLDESTLGALNKGIDPKQHLSDVAHLVLAEDPDLKSSVVRGVVVHIAARLKELGVVHKDSRRTGTAA